MKGYIYLIENKINDKKYIGKTYTSIGKRWEEHKKESKRNRAKNRPLYSAINKYGIENFTIKKIEYTENCEERENYWIEYYDSYKNGYNATLGGDGKTYFEFSDEEVVKKYEELKSVIKTAEYFGCCVETISTRLKNNLIDVPKGGNLYNKERNWETKKVCQYSLEGFLINEFYSLCEAGRWIIKQGITSAKLKNISNNISRTAKGIENRKQAYGYIWRIKE